MWGIDNWIHTSEHDGLLRPKRGQFEYHPTLLRGQWGVTMDDVGRVFRNWNEGALYVDLFPARYLARNPNLVRTRGAYEPLMAPEDQSVWPVRPTRGVNRGYREGTLRADGTLSSYVGGRNAGRLSRRSAAGRPARERLRHRTGRQSRAPADRHR